MAEPLFISAEEWVEQVRRVVDRPGGALELQARGLDRERVLAVARAEAASAGAHGVAPLSHDELAHTAGVPRSEVLRARLYLVDVGLQSLSMTSGASVCVQRLLHGA
jgi:hypothetical protein